MVGLDQLFVTKKGRYVQNPVENQKRIPKIMSFKKSSLRKLEHSKH